MQGGSWVLARHDAHRVRFLAPMPSASSVHVASTHGARAWVLAFSPPRPTNIGCELSQWHDTGCYGKISLFLCPGERWFKYRRRANFTFTFTFQVDPTS